MKAIIQVIGPNNAGKTTICDLLLQELCSRGTVSLLAIDASPDMQLTRHLTLDSAKQTLNDVTQRFGEKPSLSNEAIDWQFNDLTMVVNSEIDLLTVGPMPKQLPVGIEKMVSYGLNRLIEGYDAILIDGEHPFFSRYLPTEQIKTLVVITPTRWEKRFILPEQEPYKTPTVIINQCDEKALSAHLVGEIGDALDEALDGGLIRLIGKLPQYTSQDQIHRDFPQAFHNCLLRMDLPFIAPSSK